MLRGELFSTDMVRAYLDGRKKHTCRPVKPQPPQDLQYSCGLIAVSTNPHEEGKFCWKHGDIYDNREHMAMPKHQPGDYIYCRETWSEDPYRYMYKADYADTEKFYQDSKEILIKWRPSIHMPKEVARLFFRVTKMGVMRLEDVTEEFAQKDGFLIREGFSALVQFKHFWRQTYGPEARWMWVYWTESCSREEALEKQWEAAPPKVPNE